jgi:putative tryptophan/tyrosine transport system substrate-binding protein
VTSATAKDKTSSSSRATPTVCRSATRQEGAALLEWKPDVVVAANGGMAIAPRESSTSVPIVVASGGDLVGMGLAVSLARPGKNVTGSQILSLESTGKRLQLVTELVPRINRLGVLHTIPIYTEIAQYFDRIVADVGTTARPLSIQTFRFTVVSTDELEGVLAEMARRGIQAVIVPGSPFMIANAQRLAELGLCHRLPAIYENPIQADTGGLISYGYKPLDLYRRAARYVDRILKGAKPAELPVEQATEFELAINLKTAKTFSVSCQAICF